MRATSKTITFDFSFDYPSNGQYASASAVTVCEPGFDNRDVFRRMGGFIAAAQKGMIKTFAGMSRDQITEKVEADTMVQEDADASTVDPLEVLRMGLSGDEYEAMMKMIERALTGNKMLAYVGSDAEVRVPVTEEVWRNISDAGGLAEMERVHAEFIGFFTNTPQAPAGSTKMNGDAKPSSSPALPRAASRSKVH